MKGSFRNPCTASVWKRIRRSYRFTSAAASRTGSTVPTSLFTSIMDTRAVGLQGALQIGQETVPLPVGGQVGPPSLCPPADAGPEDGAVLDGGGDDVAALMPVSARPQAQGPVVASVLQEVNTTLPGLAAQSGGHRFPGPLQLLSGLLAQGVLGEGCRTLRHHPQGRLGGLPCTGVVAALSKYAVMLNHLKSKNRVKWGEIAGAQERKGTKTRAGR